MSLEWATQLTDIMGLGQAAAANGDKSTTRAGLDDETLIARVLERRSQTHFR